MIGLDIIQRFRDENPEIDVNVIPDSTLASWLTIGDLEVCTKARLITLDDVSITSVASQSQYDLTLLNPLFFDINEIPGGGICQFTSTTNYKRLTKTTKSYLDANNVQWRTASSGTPKYYYRTGKYIVVNPKPSSSIVNFTVDLILLPNSFVNMNITPFNQLPYLATFHYSLVLYLNWRAKVKIGKMDDANTAYALYSTYIEWMIKTIGGGKWGPIEFRPTGLPSMGFQR